MNQSKILEPLGCIPHTLFHPVTSHYPVTATAYGLNVCGSNAVKRSVAHGLEDSGLGCMIFSTPNRDCIEGQMSLHMTVAKSRLSRYGVTSETYKTCWRQTYWVWSDQLKTFFTQNHNTVCLHLISSTHWL